MTNEAIFGALKSALARGESLKKAMMTLYNAGYKREEISEAAHLINEGILSPQTEPVKKTKTKKNKKVAESKILAPSEGVPTESKSEEQSPEQIQQSQILQKNPQLSRKTQKTIQKVSGYGEPPGRKSKTVIILLGFLLLFLMGVLVTVFLFKEELLEFFNNMID